MNHPATHPSNKLTISAAEKPKSTEPFAVAKVKSMLSSQGNYLSRYLSLFGISVSVLLLLSWKMGWIETGATPGHDTVPHETPPAVTAGVEPTIELTPEKLQAAGIHIGAVESRMIRKTRWVPGQFVYDQTHYLQIHLPVDCVVLKLLAEPGKPVKQGDALAQCISEVVGEARDTLALCEGDLQLSQRDANLANEVAVNVDALVKLLSQQPTFKEVEEACSGKALKDYRDKILSSYSRLLYARNASNSLSKIADDGTMSKRVFEERLSLREQAEAQFAAICETVTIEAKRERDRTRLEFEHAERKRAIAKEKLALVQGADNTMPVTVATAKNSSHFLITAPIDGQVVERAVTESQRVSAGETLFSVADTNKLWVQAEIHERDWKALDFSPGSDSMVRVPALENAEFTSKVRFAGAKVSDDSRSVPLVLEINNHKQQFKPGMFVWVEVPLSASHEAMVVPLGAIMRHEEQSFVFLARGSHTFVRCNVETGWESSGFVEIRGELKTGDRVVDQGAFYLKSELLLEREE